MAASSDSDDERLVALLEKWGPSALSEESDMNTKMLHLDPQEAPRRQDAMRALRQQLDAAGRRAQAEKYKALANKQFGKEAWRVAAVGYLAGVWMLRSDRDDPACPLLLANHLSSMDDAVAALGPTEQTVDPDSMALRTSLQLNLAAAAIKLNEYRLARAACAVVLAQEPSHPKALWRLAKAYEGDNNITDATTTVTRLVQTDPDNKDARRLLDSLTRRKAKYGKMFHSVVERAQKEGDDLYTRREHERDVSTAMHKGFISCMGRPYGEEEDKSKGQDPLDEEDNELFGRVNSDGEEENVSLAEFWEQGYRKHAMNKKPPTDDEAACNRAMGKAYNTVRFQRETAVKDSLPPNVLASYVEDPLN